MIPYAKKAAFSLQAAHDMERKRDFLSIMPPAHAGIGMSGVTESVVEQAALAWLESVGWTVAHGSDISPAGGTLTLPLSQKEMEGYGELALAQRLRDALARLNPALPIEGSIDRRAGYLTRRRGVEAQEATA